MIFTKDSLDAKVGGVQELVKSENISLPTHFERVEKTLFNGLPPSTLGFLGRNPLPILSSTSSTNWKSDQLAEPNSQRRYYGTFRIEALGLCETRSAAGSMFETADMLTAR